MKQTPFPNTCGSCELDPGQRAAEDFDEQTEGKSLVPRGAP